MSKLSQVTESAETAIVATTPTLSANFTDDINVLNFNDFPVPRLQLMQGQSDLVKKPAPEGYTRPQAGDFVVPVDDGNNGYYIAKEVNIVVLKVKRHFTDFYKKDGVDVFETWAEDPHDSEKPYGNVHPSANPKLTFSYVVMVIDPTEKHDNIIATIDFSKSNLGAAKSINAALKKFGFRKVCLLLKAKYNETAFSYYSITVSASAVTQEEVAAALELAPI